MPRAITPQFLASQSPSLRPTIGGGNAAVTIAQPEVDPSLGLVAGLSATLSGVFARLAVQRRDQARREGLQKAKGAVAANPELVDELLAGTERDATAVAAGGISDDVADTEARKRLRRKMQQAVDAGIISKTDDPFFRTELLAALGDRAAAQAKQNTMARLAAGEHLSKEDENGNPVAGKPFEEIWQEETSRVKSGIVLDSPLASETFGARVAGYQSQLEQVARRSVDEQEIARLTRIRTDQITTSTIALAQAMPADRAESSAAVSRSIDALRDANDPDWREKSVNAVVKAANYMAIDDPDGALRFLNTVAGDVMIGNQRMDDNPDAAIALNRERLRLQSVIEQEDATEARRAEIARNQTLRGVQEEIGRVIDSLRENGAGPVQLEQAAFAAIDGMLEDDPNRGVVGTDARRYARAVISESTSNPNILADLNDRTQLALTPADFEALRQEVDARAGVDLFGAELTAARAKIDDRAEFISGSGLASNQTFARTVSELSQFAPPGNAAPQAWEQTDRELDALSVEFQRAAQADIVANQGVIDTGRILALATDYKRRATEIVNASRQESDKVEAEALELVRTGGRASDLSAYEGRLSPTVLANLRQRADQTEAIRQDLSADRQVQIMLSQVKTLAMPALSGLPESAQAQALQDLEAEQLAIVEEVTRDPKLNLSFPQARNAVVDRIRQWKNEKAEAFAESNQAAAEAFAQASEGRIEAVEVSERFRMLQDSEGRLAQLEDPRVPHTAVTDPALAQLVPDPRRFRRIADSQALSSKRGELFAPNLTADQIRDRVLHDLHTIGRQTPGLFPEANTTTIPGPSFTPDEALAAMAPVGLLTVDDVVSGSFSVPPPPGTKPAKAGLLPAPQAKLPLDARRIPPFTTPLFRDLEELRAFQDSPQEAALFDKLGLVTEDLQKRWVKAQSTLISRLNR